MSINTESFTPLNISVMIVSDTRNENSDKSGKILSERIKQAGHKLVKKIFVKDEPVEIENELLKFIKNKELIVVILSGGTGLTGRDSTPEVVIKII